MIQCLFYHILKVIKWEDMVEHLNNFQLVLHQQLVKLGFILLVLLKIKVNVGRNYQNKINF